MWDKIIKYLPQFSSAVLNTIDEKGYPFSIRCITRPDSNLQVLQLDVPESGQLYAGKASLLYHKHDQELAKLKSFVIRGKLEQTAQGWLFRPEKFIPGVGVGGPFATLQVMREASQTTTAYLAKRGLARPAIDWDGFVAIKKAVKAII